MGLKARAFVNIAALVMSLAACASEPTTPTALAQSVDIDRLAFVEALKLVRGRPPVIAVLALNEGTETTDFLVPHAVLQRAGGATVEAVAPRRGRVTLMPALEVELREDLESFDSKYPSGADYVIVPAMHVDDDPAILGWIRAQHGKGAIVIGICSGALVVGNAGLLDARRYTGHWYDRAKLQRRHPTATHVPDRRYIIDRGVATTTGVTASAPTALALVEAISGHARAAAVAEELGIASWGPGHDSAAFRFNARRLWTLAGNAATFWRHDQLTIAVQDGVDDMQLAMAADAWSRTYRSNALAVADAGRPVRLASGLVLIPTSTGALRGDTRRIGLPGHVKPAQQLDLALCGIGRRYGAGTRDLVALQMEHRLGDWASGECSDAELEK